MGLKALAYSHIKTHRYHVITCTRQLPRSLGTYFIPYVSFQLQSCVLSRWECPLSATIILDGGYVFLLIRPLGLLCNPRYAIEHLTMHNDTRTLAEGCHNLHQQQLSLPWTRLCFASCQASYCTRSSAEPTMSTLFTASKTCSCSLRQHELLSSSIHLDIIFDSVRPW